MTMNSSKAGNVPVPTIDLTKDDDEKNDTKVSALSESVGSRAEIVSESVGCSTAIARILLVKSDWDVNQAVEDFYHANESWIAPSADTFKVIRTVMDLVGCRHEIARYLLEYCDWNVDTVVKDVYGFIHPINNYKNTPIDQETFTLKLGTKNHHKWPPNDQQKPNTVYGSSSDKKSCIDSPVRSHSSKLENSEDINYVKNLVGCCQEIARYLLKNYEWNVNKVVLDFIKFSYGKTVAAGGTTKGGISSVLKRKRNATPVDDKFNNKNEVAYRMLRETFTQELSKMRGLKKEEGVMTIVDCSRCSAPQIINVKESRISCPVCKAKTCRKCNEQEHEEGKDCEIKRARVMPSTCFDAKCNKQEQKEGKDCESKGTKEMPSRSFNAKFIQQEHEEGKECESKKTRVLPSRCFDAKGYQNQQGNHQEQREGKDCESKRTKVMPSRSFGAKGNQNQQGHEEGKDCWFKRTRVLPSRSFDAENNLEHEFRIAEGQFLRMKREGRRYEIQSIDIIENEKLKAKFENKRQDLKAKGIDDKPLLIFHGTPQANIEPILRNNFDIKKIVNGRVHGDGVYFSEMPEVSLGYSRDMQSLILCMVLLGENSKEVKKTEVGAWAVVVPDVDQILPKYVINFKISGITPPLARIPVPVMPHGTTITVTPIASTSGTGTDRSALISAVDMIASLRRARKNKRKEEKKKEKRKALKALLQSKRV